MSEDLDRIDTVTAERLLRRAETGAPVGSQPVADLLAAAAFPARPDELTGEETAVQAFRDAHLATAPRPGRRPVLKGVLVKASAVAAVTVIAGGGVAVAAGTGHLHDTRAHGDHGAARSTSSARAEGKGDTLATGRRSRPPEASTSTHRAAASQSADPGDRSQRPKPGGRASQILRGLCIAFRAQAAHDPRGALDNPAFKVLIEKAGGRNEVAAYCGRLLAGPDGRHPSRQAREPDHSRRQPTGPAGDPDRRHHPWGPPAPTGHIP